MTVLGYPENAQRFTNIPVRVRITNNGDSPIKGCGDFGTHGEECVAVGWHTAGDPVDVMTLPSENMMSSLTNIEYLMPGESVEKTLKVASRKLKKGKALNVYLIVKKGNAFEIKQETLKINVQEASPDVKKRRLGVRLLAWAYLALIILSTAFIYKRARG